VEDCLSGERKDLRTLNILGVLLGSFLTIFNEFTELVELNENGHYLLK